MSNVNLFAFYTVTEGNLEMMDKAADHAMVEFAAKDIGRGTFLPKSERDIQWQLPADKAEAASAMLDKLGFRTKIKAIA